MSSPRSKLDKAIRITSGVPYLRDMFEVLILDRLRGSTASKHNARNVAATVRKARFHAHATIPSVKLEAVVRCIDPDSQAPLILPPPMSFEGVGNIDYYHALAAIVQATNPCTALEFGTYLGVGTLTIALNAPLDCRIATIDLPDDDADTHDLNWTDIALVDESRYRVGEVFLGSAAQGRIEQIRADSLVWNADPSLAPLDLVLIDGGHSKSIVRADTENALRLLGPEGVILWDDYFYLYPEVVSYLDELAADGRPMVSIDHTNLVVYSKRLEGLVPH